MPDQNKSVVFLGAPGSFSEQATEEIFGDKINKIRVFSFMDLCRTVSESAADFGVIPIENSIAGAVHEALSAINSYSNLKIKTKFSLNIKLGLYAMHQDLAKITELYSHQKAFEQSGEFLKRFSGLKQHITSDTASAAKLVSESQLDSTAAICSKYCAEIYQLECVLDCVQDREDNKTEFAVIFCGEK